MSDTIFYKGKLKRTKTPAEVFAKIQKAVKKKGPTKNWICTVDDENQTLFIDFNDGKSETFGLSFNGLEFNDFCKVYFPLDGELFEDGKSEFKALLDVLYSAKSMFSKIEITDDYCLAETYWADKRFKIKFRELTEEETARVRRLFDAGYTTHEDMIKAVIAEDMGMSVKNLETYVNPSINNADSDCLPYAGMLETYLYEATTYQKKGRTCEQPNYEYYDLSSLCFSIYAFALGLSELFFDEFEEYANICPNVKKGSFGAKHAQVRLLFREKFYPAYTKEDDAYKQCILAYRFFLSTLDYTGFQYAGRIAEPRTPFGQILERYGEELGNLFLTAYCTTNKYIFPASDDAEKARFGDALVKNISNSYGKEILEEYLAFKREYQENSKFRMEVKYTIGYTTNYVDKSLLSVG